MRKLFSLLLLVLLVITPLCAQSAMAQTGHEYLASLGATLIPSSRVTLNVPASLRYTLGSEAGKADYVVHIDRENTDWPALLGEYLSPFGPLMLNDVFKVTPPEGTVSYRVSQRHVGSGDDPEPGKEPTFEEALAADAAKAFNNLMPSDFAMSSNWSIGRFDTATGSFSPYLNHWLGNVYNLQLYCWVDADGKETYEYMVTSMQMADRSAFVIEFPALTTADLIPAANLPEAQKSQINIEIANNNVSYHLDSPDVLSGETLILTGIRSPFDAQSDWTCTVTGYNGDPTYTPEQLEKGIPLSIPTEDGSVSTATFMLTWRDADGMFKTARSLTLSLTVGQPTPWPSRVGDWTPVPQDRMRVEITNAYPGLDLTYAEKKNGNKLGVIETTIDQSTLPNDQPLDSSEFMVYLLPPDGAVQFKIYEYLPFAYNPLTAHSIKDNMYNYSSGTPEEAERGIASSPLLNVADHLSPNGLLIYGNHFMSARPLKLANGGELLLYTANNLDNTRPYRGAYRLYNWYDADGNIIRVNGKPLNEYYVIDMSTDVLSISTAVSTSLEEMRKQNAKYPRLRIEQGGSDGETYYFWFNIVPQSNAGENADDNAKRLCYNLYITDASGNVLSDSQVKGLGEISVYLPYPEGVTFRTVEDYIISVSHLAQSGSEYAVIETFDGNKLEFTEDGIRFTATSFSPYMLSWEFEHTLTTTASGNVITQTCTCGDKATATVSAKETYAVGEKVEAELSFTGSWQGVKPTVTYRTNDGKALAKAPTAPGKYSAAIESDGALAEVFFSIVAAPQSVLPQTGDPSLPLLMLAAAALCALGAMQLLRRKRA